MKRVIDYVKQDKKTLIENESGIAYNVISGKDCCPETTFEEFMATKKQYGKDKGMFFYQYVQSFSPDEKITPQQANEVGCKLAGQQKIYHLHIARGQEMQG